MLNTIIFFVNIENARPSVTDRYLVRMASGGTIMAAVHSANGERSFVIALNRLLRISRLDSGGGEEEEEEPASSPPDMFGCNITRLRESNMSIPDMTNHPVRRKYRSSNPLAIVGS
jgi:hypothetical protein